MRIVIKTGQVSQFVEIGLFEILWKKVSENKRTK